MTAAPYISGTKMERMLSFLRAYKRGIVSSLVFAYAAFLLIHPDEEGRAFDLVFFALLVTLIASPLFWIRRIVDVGERFLPGKPGRAWLGAIVGAIYLVVLVYNMETWESAAWNSTHVSTALTLRSVLLEAPFWWWFVGSFAGFFLVLAFWTVDRAAGAAAWLYRKARNAASPRAALRAEELALVPPSPSRRQFLERAAVLVSATPSWPPAMGFSADALMWKSRGRPSDCHACPKPSRDSVSPNFPICTSALS